MTATCSKACKHYGVTGYCNKYREFIRCSKSIFHMGLPLHPFHYMDNYYEGACMWKGDVKHIVDVFKEFHSNDDKGVSICKYYDDKGKLSKKQKYYLLHIILNCYEPKDPPDYEDGWYQVED